MLIGVITLGWITLIDGFKHKIVMRVVFKSKILFVRIKGFRSRAFKLTSLEFP